MKKITDMLAEDLQHNSDLNGALPRASEAHRSSRYWNILEAPSMRRPAFLRNGIHAK